MINVKRPEDPCIKGNNHSRGFDPIRQTERRNVLLQLILHLRCVYHFTIKHCNSLVRARNSSRDHLPVIQTLASNVHVDGDKSCVCIPSAIAIIYDSSLEYRLTQKHYTGCYEQPREQSKAFPHCAEGILCRLCDCESICIVHVIVYENPSIEYEDWDLDEKVSLSVIPNKSGILIRSSCDKIPVWISGVVDSRGKVFQPTNFDPFSPISLT